MTAVLQAFRKAIGVRIKEETEIIEGEVSGVHALSGLAHSNAVSVPAGKSQSAASKQASKQAQLRAQRTALSETACSSAVTTQMTHRNLPRLEQAKRRAPCW